MGTKAKTKFTKGIIRTTGTLEPFYSLTRTDLFPAIRRLNNQLTSVVVEQV